MGTPANDWVCTLGKMEYHLGIASILYPKFGKSRVRSQVSIQYFEQQKYEFSKYPGIGYTPTQHTLQILYGQAASPHIHIVIYLDDCYGC